MSTDPSGSGLAAEDTDVFDSGSIFRKSIMSAPSSPSGRGGGRTSFIPASESPGPAAYTPNVNSIKITVPRSPFGTSNRQHESHRYVSDLHNKGMGNTDTPGPGTYRVSKAESYPNSPKHHGPAFGFGSSPQRLESSRGTSPGAVYCQEPPRTAPSYTFAPMGSMEQGMSRSRQDAHKMFLSNEHSRVDMSPQAQDHSLVGPGLYEVHNQECMSPKKAAPRAVFGKSTRDVQDSMLKDQMRVDPLHSSAATTPGAIYDYPSTLGPKTHKFGGQPRMFSPEKGMSSAGPYLSRLHEQSMQGACSPGPGAYDVQGGRGKAVTGMGDAPTFPFGGAPDARDNLVMRMDVPGPGTYHPKEGTSGSSYSMGANIRTDFADPGATGPVPGPGAYNVAEASKNEGQSPKSPSFSMGAQSKDGRGSFIRHSCSPGPVYSPGNGGSQGPGKGFSFGLKERTKSLGSTLAVRYHGPLAAKESLGTAGPGPVYDVDSFTKLSGKKDMPFFKIGTASRSDGPKIFISKQHAEADGAGVDAPGPGTYDNHRKELATVTSKYQKPASAVFSTTQRFKSNYSTF